MVAATSRTLPPATVALAAAGSLPRGIPAGVAAAAGVGGPLATARGIAMWDVKLHVEAMANSVAPRVFGHLLALQRRLTREVVVALYTVDSIWAATRDAQAARKSATARTFDAARSAYATASSVVRATLALNADAEAELAAPSAAGSTAAVSTASSRSVGAASALPDAAAASATAAPPAAVPCLLFGAHLDGINVAVASEWVGGTGGAVLRLATGRMQVECAGGGAESSYLSGLQWSVRFRDLGVSVTTPDGGGGAVGGAANGVEGGARGWPRGLFSSAASDDGSRVAGSGMGGHSSVRGSGGGGRVSGAARQEPRPRAPSAGSTHSADGASAGMRSSRIGGGGGGGSYQDALYDAAIASLFGPPPRTPPALTSTALMLSPPINTPAYAALYAAADGYAAREAANAAAAAAAGADAPSIVVPTLSPVDAMRYAQRRALGAVRVLTRGEAAAPTEDGGLGAGADASQATLMHVAPPGTLLARFRTDIGVSNAAVGSGAAAAPAGSNTQHVTLDVADSSLLLLPMLPHTAILMVQQYLASTRAYLALVKRSWVAATSGSTGSGGGGGAGVAASSGVGAARGGSGMAAASSSARVSSLAAGRASMTTTAAGSSASAVSLADARLRSRRRTLQVHDAAMATAAATGRGGVARMPPTAPPRRPAVDAVAARLWGAVNPLVQSRVTDAKSRLLSSASEVSGWHVVLTVRRTSIVMPYFPINGAGNSGGGGGRTAPASGSGTGNVSEWTGVAASAAGRPRAGSGSGVSRRSTEDRYGGYMAEELAAAENEDLLARYRQGSTFFQHVGRGAARGSGAGTRGGGGVLVAATTVGESYGGEYDDAGDGDGDGGSRRAGGRRGGGTGGGGTGVGGSRAQQSTDSA